MLIIWEQEDFVQGEKNFSLHVEHLALKIMQAVGKSGSIPVIPFLKPLALLWAGSPDLAVFYTLHDSNKIPFGTLWVLIIILL